MEFKDMMKVANEIDAEAVRLRDKLIADVCDLPLKGKYINDGKNGGPVIAIVNFSDLEDNWSPEYHLPPQQARIIKKCLIKFNTAHGIIAAVRNMLEKGYVVDNCNKAYLNDRTILTIRESELGEYAVNTHRESVTIEIKEIAWMPSDRVLPPKVNLECDSALLHEKGCMDGQGEPIFGTLYDEVMAELEAQYECGCLSFDIGKVVIKNKLKEPRKTEV